MLYRDIIHIVTCAFPSLAEVIKSSCTVRVVSILGTLQALFRLLLGRSRPFIVRQQPTQSGLSDREGFRRILGPDNHVLIET